MRNDVIKEQTIPMNPDKNIHNKFDRDVSSLDRDMRSGITFCERCPEWWRWSMKLPSPVAFFTVQRSTQALHFTALLAHLGETSRASVFRARSDMQFRGKRPIPAATLSNPFKGFYGYLNLLEIQVHSYLKVLPSNIKKIMRAIVPFNASYQIHTCGWKI